MTTITITIDDPNGLNSNLFFPSAFPYRMNSAFGATEGNSGWVQFRRFSAGAVDLTTLYELAGTGNSIESGEFVDVKGHFNSLRLTRDPFGSAVTMMHATFALDDAWASRGGVFLNSLTSLTADVLMARVQQFTTANLVLVGNVGNDVLNGSFLDDTLRGGPGGDRLNGGEGSDTASYEFSSAGVTVNLATGTSSGADAERDRFSSIENLLGSSFNDRLTGSAGANLIDGGLGFDTIDGGAGNDFIFGRNGGGVLRGAPATTASMAGSTPTRFTAALAMTSFASARAATSPMARTETISFSAIRVSTAYTVAPATIHSGGYRATTSWMAAQVRI